MIIINFMSDSHNILNSNIECPLWVAMATVLKLTRGQFSLTLHVMYYTSSDINLSLLHIRT